MTTDNVKYLALIPAQLRYLPLVLASALTNSGSMRCYAIGWHLLDADELGVWCGAVARAAAERNTPLAARPVPGSVKPSSRGRPILRPHPVAPQSHPRRLASDAEIVSEFEIMEGIDFLVAYRITILGQQRQNLSNVLPPRHPRWVYRQYQFRMMRFQQLFGPV